MDEIANHYEILDLQSDCTNEQIKQKFRQLALKVRIVLIELFSSKFSKVFILSRKEL